MPQKAPLLFSEMANQSQDCLPSLPQTHFPPSPGHSGLLFLCIADALVQAFCFLASLPHLSTFLVVLSTELRTFTLRYTM